MAVIEMTPQIRKVGVAMTTMHARSLLAEASRFAEQFGVPLVAILLIRCGNWCRVSALINLTVADYYERGGTRWLRFLEKRGKEREVPVHSKAKEVVDLWLERSRLAANPSAPLCPSFGKNRETIELRRLDRRSVLKLVEKRAKASGILKRVCCHSFCATGVTEYMNSGGTIEIAQRIADHTSPATTRIYDRSGDRVTLEEIERVQIGLTGHRFVTQPFVRRCLQRTAAKRSLKMTGWRVAKRKSENLQTLEIEHLVSKLDG
jgi:integrase